MLQDIYYSRKSNKAVQVISQCQIIPEGTDAICFQELTGEFGCRYIQAKDESTRGNEG